MDAADHEPNGSGASSSHASTEGANPTPNRRPDSSFTFAMGDFVARFPGDREYATNHMWASAVDANRFRLGLTAYAVRLLQDVYFLDWLLEPPAALQRRQTIGSIESKKAESDLFSPADGKLIAINDAVIDDPSLINADTYGDGWLIEIISDDPPWLSPDGYAEHLVDAWDVAQRTIKGQANH